MGDAESVDCAEALGAEAVALMLATEGVGALVTEGAPLAPALADATLPLALAVELSRDEEDALRLASGEREVVAEAERVASAVPEREAVGQEDTEYEASGEADADGHVDGVRVARSELVIVGEEVGEERAEAVACESVGCGELDLVPTLGLAAEEIVAPDCEAADEAEGAFTVAQAVPLALGVREGVLQGEDEAAPEGDAAPLLDAVPLCSTDGDVLAVPLAVGAMLLAELHGDAVADGEVERLMEGERVPLGLPEGDRDPTTLLVGEELLLEVTVDVVAADGVARDAVALREGREGVGAGEPVAIKDSV